MDVRSVLAAAACCARPHRSFAQASGGVWKSCSRGKRANKISSRAAHGGRSLRLRRLLHVGYTRTFFPRRRVANPSNPDPFLSLFSLYTRVRACGCVRARVRALAIVCACLPCLGRGASDQSSWGSSLMCLPESVGFRSQIHWGSGTRSPLWFSFSFHSLAIKTNRLLFFGRVRC